jgi:hypothetical protein
VRPSVPSIPPSQPRTPSRLSHAEIERQDRASRLQMLGMLALGMVLIGVPLYFWRRPAQGRTETPSQTPQLSEALPFAPTTTAGLVDGGVEPKVAFGLGDVRVLSCRDARKEASECGKLPVLEEALVKAIREHATCLPAAAGGGTVQYLADVNFAKKHIGILTPRDGRSVHNAKLLRPCTTAIKRSLESLSLASVEHAHVHYKLSVVATYPP